MRLIIEIDLEQAAPGDDIGDELYRSGQIMTIYGDTIFNDLAGAASCSYDDKSVERNLCGPLRNGNNQECGRISIREA